MRLSLPLFVSRVDFANHAHDTAAANDLAVIATAAN
jgi:hypothetical protein